MSRKSLSFDELLDAVENLTFKEFKDVVTYFAYTSEDKMSYQSFLDTAVNLDFQKRLEKLGVNTCCPACNSTMIVKNGKKKNSTQQYVCLDCKRNFNRFTNTVLEKTKWHWDIWIEVLNMTINSFSFLDTKNVLERDFGCTGISEKTLFLWRHKLIHALAQMPMPQLTGVIQVDETFIREAQKGSRTLESYLGVNDERKPRYGRNPSKYGIMGPEFATVTTAVDNHGYCVCKVSCLGRLTFDLFVKQFEEHLDNPSFICSDANTVYEKYCGDLNIPHYIKPSNYLDVIKNNGFALYLSSDPHTAKLERERNKNILRNLYTTNDIDYILNRGRLSFDEFDDLKNKNSLSLGRVNALHKDIKNYIYRKMTNVSTKYLEDYIGFFTFLRNWRVKNGHYPSSRKDAESIFIELLKNKVTYKTHDIKNAEVNLVKPSGKYVSNLKRETDNARAVLANEYFKFNSEDKVWTFSKRKYLDGLPKSKITEIAKNHHIKGYTKLNRYSLTSLILKLPNIEEVILDLRIKGDKYRLSDEDIDAIQAGQFVQSINIP